VGWLQIVSISFPSVVQDKAQRPPAPANHYSLECDHCY